MSAPDLFENINDFLLSMDVDGRVLDQYNFELWMDLTRKLAWDIPSALGSVCTHDELPEFPMHWSEDAEEAYSTHFREEHGLEFASKINWDFDT